MVKYYQGRFKPVNLKKYKGDFRNIIYRSLWERKAMKWADLNQNVLTWSSEEIVIPYYSPVDNKMHRYFPDLFLVVRSQDGGTRKILVEIKPKKETQRPKPTNTGKITKRYLREATTYTINVAKWKAAKEYCQKRGWEFIFMTEKELGT